MALLQLTELAVWDTGLKIWDQTEETQMFLLTARQGMPVERITEPCANGNMRVVTETFQAGACKMKITYEYINTPFSNEWAGMAGEDILIYGE